MKTELSLKAKMNVVRLELSKKMEKSGKNDFSHYDYFQLRDFMPQIIDLCNENGLFTKFWIDYEKIETSLVKTTKKETDDATGISSETVVEESGFELKEFAYLEVTDLESGDVELFKKETAECRLSGAQPIQNTGGKSTYMKRYMYMDAFEINENDAVEEQTGKPVKVEPKKETTKPKTKTVTAEVTKPVEEVKEANIEEINTDELMSMDHKVELANYMKEKGLEPKATIVEAAKALGTDVPLLKESDFEKVKEYVDKK